MTEKSNVVFRERPLPEVKAEITRRAGHLNPLDGIRVEDAERVSQALTSLDRDEWAREWSKFGVEYEAQADALEKSGGDKTKIRELYELSFHNFRVGRYPCAGSPGQAQAYRDSLRVFRKAARYFDPPMEIIEVPFGDKKLIGYLQIPRGVVKPPVVMHWGGVDGWKEDRQRAHARFNRAGIAGFAIDMPGTGESPVLFTDADAARTFSVLIDYLLRRKDIDATRPSSGALRGFIAQRPLERTFAVIDARPMHCDVMRRSAFCSRSRGPTLAEAEVYRLDGKAQLFPQRLGIVPRRRLFHPHRGTHRK